jgi:hypothetical protein
MADAENTEIAEVENETQWRSQLDIFGYDPDMDFRKLALEAQYHSRGFRLIEKDALIGVPFVIIGLVYRDGFPRNGKAGDYVSVEAVTADARTMETPVVRAQMGREPTVFGNEPVVFNDSSTGVRRQVTELLHSSGIINVGAKADIELDAYRKARTLDEAQRAAALNPFDRSYQFWKDGEERATSGIRNDGSQSAFSYLANRGLRKSDYESPFGPATTYYLG